MSELEREIDVRERCYRRWVKDGKMSVTDALDRFERLASAIQYIRMQVNEHPEHLDLVPSFVDPPKELAPTEQDTDGLPF